MTIYKVNIVKDIVYSAILTPGIETIVCTMRRKSSEDKLFSTREKANAYLEALKNESFKRGNYEDFPHYLFTSEEYDILVSSIIKAGYSYKRTLRRAFEGKVESITVE